MSIPTEVIMRMATLGLSEEQARAVADMLTAVEAATKSESDALIEQGRAKVRDRVQRWRESKRGNVTKRSATSHGVTSRLASVEDKTSSSDIEPLKEVKKARGTRLPSDFTLPSEWHDWAIRRGLPPHRVPIEFEKLTNWAANAQGSKGVKSDWFKAWQNWVLGAVDQLPQNRAPPPQKPRSVQDAIRDLDARLETANANAPTEIQGNPAAAFRLSAPQFGGR